MRHPAASACLVLAATMAAPAFAAGEPPRAIVLLQSKGFVHDVVKAADGRPSVVQRVLTSLAEESGAFAPTFTDDATTLTPEALRDAQLVIFYTTGDDLPLDVVALDNWVRGGGAFLGLHCATDTLKNDPTYRNLVGAAFREHPWNAGDTVTIRADDAAHPAAQPYAPSATFAEEIYRFRAPLDDEHVILSLDQEKTEKKIEERAEVPIAWTREHGGGRVFYSSLGHRQDVWESEEYQRHLLGAIAWLTGRDAATAADAAASPPNTLTEAEEAAGWRLLFNGRTTNGWRAFQGSDMPAGWQVIDGALTRAHNGGDIVTTDQFGDFELVIDWKVRPGGNSGIFYRATETRAPVWRDAIEYQVLGTRGHGRQGPGSLYDLVAPEVDATRMPGQWNTARIVARGDHVEHWLNGQKLLTVDLSSDEFRHLVEHSKFRGGSFAKAKRGHIALQDHGDWVAYHNIKIRELK